MSRRRQPSAADAFGEALADLAWNVAARLVDGIAARIEAPPPPPPRQLRRPPRGAGRKPPAGPVLQTRKIRGVWHAL